MILYILFLWNGAIAQDLDLESEGLRKVDLSESSALSAEEVERRKKIVERLLKGDIEDYGGLSEEAPKNSSER